MAKYIINEKLYNTRKMWCICATITYSIFCTKEVPRDFIKVDTFYGIQMGHANKISEIDAKARVGREGFWKDYEKLWGLPEGHANKK